MGRAQGSPLVGSQSTISPISDRLASQSFPIRHTRTTPRAHNLAVTNMDRKTVEDLCQKVNGLERVVYVVMADILVWMENARLVKAEGGEYLALEKAASMENIKRAMARLAQNKVWGLPFAFAH